MGKTAPASIRTIMVVVASTVVPAAAVIAPAIIARIAVIPVAVIGPTHIDTDKPRPGASSQRERQ
jgi:hypothetical protein